MRIFIVAILLLCFQVMANCQQPSNIKTDSLVKNGQQINEIEDRIAEIENERKVYDKFFDKLEGMTSSFSTYLAWLSIFLAFVSAVMLAFQIAATKRDSKVMDEMRSSFMETINAQVKTNNTHEDYNRKLLDSVIKNVEQTSSFIGSYENLIKIKQSSEEVNAKIALIDKKEKERTDSLIAIQSKLNAKSVRLMESVFNSSYGSTFFDKAELYKFSSFFIEANAQIAYIASNPEVEKYCNGAIYFLMGLDQFLSNQPIDTEKYLKRAEARITQFIKTPPSIEDAEIIYPESDNYNKHGGKENWNKKLSNVCDFYLGLINYKLGRFKDSIPYFKDSVELFPYEPDAIFYLYQSKYWGNEFTSLSDLVEEMTTKMNSAVAQQNRNEEKQMLEVRLKTKIGDFCRISDENQITDLSIEDSISSYKIGYQMIKGINGSLDKIPKQVSQVVPLTYFGLAKSLQIAEGGSIVSEIKKEELYKQTIDAVNWMIESIENHETRYLLFYILGYCKDQLTEYKDALESIEAALSQFKDYYSHIDYYAYSPINNVMRPKTEIETELLNYRKSILKKQS